jgi:hypothetical protein
MPANIASDSVFAMTSEPAKPTCFIAMPITVHDPEAKLYGDDAHWEHVIEHLFVPAIEAAGYDPIRPTASGTSMIHGRIVKHLSEAELVLCDLSQHNPNVLFELGVRTSLNKPVALVKDEHLKLPFDIQGLNTHPYASNLSPWTLPEQVELLTKHITESVAESHGTNPLWEHFGVAIAAAQPPLSSDPAGAKMQVILERMDRIEQFVQGRGVQVANMIMSMEQYDEVAMALLALEGVESVGTDGDSNRLIIHTAFSNSDTQQARIDLLSGTVAKIGYPVTVGNWDPTTVVLAVGWDRRAWR